MMNKVISLTRVFCKDYYQSLYLVKDNNKLNKKNIFLWLIIILMIALGFISYKVINYLEKFGQAEIFLNVYFFILAIIQIFQTILICSNIFYFSKDLEYVLPLPLKPIELLISKFNNVVFILYVSELIFAVIPFGMYGLLASDSILYFPLLIVVLLIFPIFMALIVSIVMLFVMKLAKFIKNKDIFQLIVVFVLVSLLVSFLVIAVQKIFSIGDFQEIATTEKINNELSPFNEKLKKINEYFLIINPIINILGKSNLILKIINLLKILIIEFVFFIFFILAGKWLYLKNILKNLSYINTKKKNAKVLRINKISKRKNKRKSYVSKELKVIIKNPIFFMQYIYPIITLLIVVIVIISTMWPVILEIISIDEVSEQVEELEFCYEFICLILTVIQIINSFINISISAISREGKNAICIKYIPISYYKQFLYKNVIQIIISNIVSISILTTLYFVTESIGIVYIIGMFIISFLINIINSYLMCIVDLRKPNLNWDNEISVTKKNDNKLFQYVFTVFIFLSLLYLNEIFIDLNLGLSIILTIFIFLIILIIIDRIVYKKQNKLFNKIF